MPPNPEHKMLGRLPARFTHHHRRIPDFLFGGSSLLASPLAKNSEWAVRSLKIFRHSQGEAFAEVREIHSDPSPRHVQVEIW